VTQTVLKPSRPADPPGAFWRFVNFLRANIGLRSLELADRYAEAKVTDKEYDVQIRVLNARLEYEKAMAQVRELDRKGKADAEEKRAVAAERQAAAEGKRADARITKARARAEAAKARQEEARARMAEHIERLVKARELGPEEAMEWLGEVISRIEFQHDGRVEIQPPNPSPKHADDEGKEN
jgi:hypothetical protein